MAHFAKIDENNIVIDVLVVNNEVILENGNESEQKGIDFLNSLFGNATWVQTSYNGSFRKQFAGLGYMYDEINDVFIQPQPFESWTLDENFDWQPPQPYPTDGDVYSWDEGQQQWMFVEKCVDCT